MPGALGLCNMHATNALPRSLHLATGAACLGALAARGGGLLGLAGVCLLALLLGRRHRAVWIAVPASLGALGIPAGPATWPEAGPVLACGRVVAEQDAEYGGTWLVLAQEDAPWRTCRLLVAGTCLARPADFVQATARLLPGGDAEAAPRLEAAAEALRVTRPWLAPRRWLADLQRALERGLAAHLGGEAHALLANLALNRGPELPEDLAAAHRATGLAHLLAVSGTHVSLLAACLALAWRTLLRQQALGSRAFRRLCAALLLGYGCVAGLEAPVVRAVAAFLLLLLARGAGRHTSLGGALALAALLTALSAPEDLGTPSFCLSYAAVLGLACAGLGRARTWPGRWLLEPLRASAWAVLATMPFTLGFFGTLSPWTILATPLLAPIVALLLPLALAIAATGEVLPGLAQALALPAAPLAACYAALVRALATLPLAPIHSLAVPEPAALVACLLLGLVVLVWWRDRRGLAALCLAAALPHFVPPPAPGTDRLQLLAVGHGQACLTTCADGTTILVDCGCLGEPRRAAHRVVQALAPRRRIDWLVVSHGDSDHAGGVARLLQLARVAAALLPDELAAGPLGASLRAAGVHVLPLAPGESCAPEPRLHCLRPLVPRSAENDASLWTRIATPGFTALVPGDAEAAGTRAYCGDAASATAEVLVLPHHGRPNPALPELLARVRPRIALVSDAEVAPSAQALVSLRAGVFVYETGRAGTLTLGPGLLVATAAPIRH